MPDLDFARASDLLCPRKWTWRPLCIFGGVLLIGALPLLTAEDLSPNQPRVLITPRESKKPAPRSDIRLDVKMVLVPVTVRDEMDRPVNNLPADAFRLLEDNVEQKIVSFWREEAPVSVGFVFDASASMEKRIDRSIAAVKRFLGTTIPGDEFFLVKFSDRPELVKNFTPDADEIMASLSFVKAEGWTSLLDAIYLGVRQMKSAKNPRRALFIHSDGSDNNSRYSESEIRRVVIESDVRIFAIGLFQRPRFLEKLAAETGGKTYWAHKLTDLPDVIDKLSVDLRSNYVIGYASSCLQNDGKYRKVTVELLRSLLGPLRISWRRGYYAPDN
jgi:Ca-activated chloride channel family protein